MNLLVRRAGFLTSVQDLGRTGSRSIGVSVGGALDHHAMRVANALVGNDEDAAGLELALGRSEFQLEDSRVVAWCGDDFAVEINGLPLDAGCTAFVNRNEPITFSTEATGSRAWLAISGGIDVPVLLGSRSTDLRAAFGGFEGRHLRDGDSLPLGRESAVGERLRKFLSTDRVSSWRAFPHWVRRTSETPYLRFVRGADWDRFSADARTALVNSAFAVTPDADRIGVRLAGPKLHRTQTSDLTSEPVAPGTIQIAADGNPIVLLNDCQTIGGYPKIGHVISVDQNAAARLKPGNTVRFHEVTLIKAHELLQKREDDFTQFRIGIGLRVL